jgi:hypothetical protein
MGSSKRVDHPGNGVIKKGSTQKGRMHFYGLVSELAVRDYSDLILSNSPLLNLSLVDFSRYFYGH